MMPTEVPQNREQTGSDNPQSTTKNIFTYVHVLSKQE